MKKNRFMGITIWLLDHPREFQIIIFFASIISFLVGFVDELLVPVFICTIFLLLIRIYPVLVRGWEIFKKVHVGYKVNVIFAIMGGIGAFYLLDSVVDLVLNPFYIWAIVLYVYYSYYFNRYSILNQFSQSFILKGHTHTDTSDISYGELVSPVLASIIVATIYITFNSFVSTFGGSFFQLQYTYILIIIPYILIHVYIHLHFEEQVEWMPETGITNFIEPTDMPPVPDIDNPFELNAYILQIGRYRTPPPEFIDFLDGNLDVLVNRSKKLPYAGFVQNLVRSYAYWGQSSKKYISHLGLIVMAMLDRFKILHLIPRYNRYTVFDFLGLLYKFGIAKDWEDDIVFEIREKRDVDNRLSWIINSDPQGISDDYFNFWDGVIFKGPLGYQILGKMDIPQSDVKTENQWGNDVWSLINEYFNRFIGPEREEAFGGKLNLSQSIKFLARKELLEDFEEDSARRKESLKKPKNRYVETVTSSDNYNHDEKQAMMRRFLDGEEMVVVDEGSIMQELGIIKDNIVGWFTGLDKRQLLIGSLLLIGSITNILIIYFLVNYVSATLGMSILGIEVFTLQFYSLYTEDEDRPTHSTTILTRAREKATNKAFNEVNEYPDLDPSKVIAIVYSILLMILAATIFY